MKRSMSFAEQIKLLKVVTGILWIVAGICSCFDNTVCSAIQMAACILGIIIIVGISVAKKEKSDEMADENLCKAKAKILDITHLSSCIIAIVAILIQGNTTITLDWSKAIPTAVFIILGIEELSVGIAFRKLEAE